MKHFILSFALLFLISVNVVAEDESESKKDPMSSSTFDGLKFRCIGPAISSGRITDFAVNPDNPAEYYVAVASGHVWKTCNSGTTYEPVFDKEKSFSIGCATMDPNNHNVIWVGTGENNSQRSVAYGNGIYRSNDGGKTWKNMGLQSSEHIAKILIDPRNSNIVYVASQGPLWGAGGDRGVFKSINGGKNWKLILEISENTGATDLAMDPRNPDIIYAAAYQRRRHVFTLINGGPESAIYKTTDAGKNWEKLKEGLPKVDIGRIGLAISPVDPDVIYAIIEAADNKGGFFRSTNRGASWEKRNEYIANSPQYYQEIVADPRDVDRVYSLDTYSKVTEDGGKTFVDLNREFRHVDDHALWINPENTNHLLIGGDGGIYETWNRGEHWHFKSNLPVTQFYRVAVDDALPFYHVYGGTQDNASMGGPSRTTSSVGIVNSDWYKTKGGDGFESQIDPEDPNIVYAQSQYGWLVRYDKRSGESIGIKPQEVKDETPLRWNWDSPLLISPHKSSRIYFAANKLFRSEDRGNTWEAISPDLTRQIDRNKLKVMGKIWSVDAVSKNRSTSLYGTIVSLSESPLKEGLIYAGTDDGLIQVTENGGQNWKKIDAFKGIPEFTYVNFVLASQHKANTVYAAFNNHKNADFKPYLLKSTDNGKSWTSIAESLPDTGSVYCIAEDHKNPNLLFAGTEFGIFFTVDGGKKWIQLKGGIPSIAIKDIAIQKRENDLVLATFGRGFYILDDYSSLRDISSSLLEKESHIFPVKNALMYIPTRTGTGVQGASYYAAENPPFGASFTYYYKEDIKTRKQIRTEKEKQLIKKNKPVPYPSFSDLRAEDEEKKPYLLFTIVDETGKAIRRLSAIAKKGVNRITWDLRYSDETPIKSKGENGDNNEDSGMLALPGTYEVHMAKVVDGKVTDLGVVKSFKAKSLRITTLADSDQELLFEFQKKITKLRRTVLGSAEFAAELKDKLNLMNEALNKTPTAEINLLDNINSIHTKLNEFMIKMQGDPTVSKHNANQPPSIMGRINTIVGEQWRTTSAPTETQKQSYQIAEDEFDIQYGKLKSLYFEEYKALEVSLEKAGAPWTPGRFPDWKKE